MEYFHLKQGAMVMNGCVGLYSMPGRLKTDWFIIKIDSKSLLLLMSHINFSQKERINQFEYRRYNTVIVLAKFIWIKQCHADFIFSSKF